MRTATARVLALLVFSGAVASLGPIASAAGAPGEWDASGSLEDARASHTATRLFGGRVLVVGGVQAGQAVSSVELYEPSSGAWTVVPALSTARFSHTATRLQDGRIVVVGGVGTSGAPLASTEIYDPKARVWSAGAPLSIARSSHTATLLPNGRILVVGGVGADGDRLASAEIYNPATGSWSPAGALSTARSEHSTTLLSNGNVLVAGGTGADGRPLATAELYSPATGDWSATGSLSAARSAHTATVLGDEISGGDDPRVLVAGGVGSDGSRQRSVELYDPRTGEWTTAGALAVGRSSHTATLLPDGLVLVAGGRGSGGSSVAAAELYDPTTARSAPTGTLGGARTSHTATVLLSGRVLVTGGAGATGGSLRSTELYEPALGARWVPTGSLRDARSGHTATLLANGNVLVAAGHRTTTAVTPPRMIDPLASAEVYQPASGTWTPTGSLAPARSFHTATLLQGRPSQCGNNCGKVLVTGGIGADSTGRAQTIASATLYDPSSGRWSTTGSMTTPRAYHTATLLPSGKVLVVGGAGPGGAEPRNANQLASAELYDPASETWTATGSLTGTTTTPATNTPRGARFGHTAALLDTGACGQNCGKVLVAGGVGGVGTGPALQSAELYDPSTGQFRATASLDQARQLQADSVLPNGKVLVLGGFHSPFSAAPPNLNSGEIYDPATETWSASGELAARRIAARATLVSNGRVIVTGGAAGGNAPGFPNVGGPALFSTEIFDPDTNAWNRTSFLNDARAYHTATLLPSGPSSVCGQNCGKLLVTGGDAELIGGFAPYFDLLSPLRSAELFAPPPAASATPAPETPAPEPGAGGPPPPAAPPAAPGTPPPAAQTRLFTAKLALARATIVRRNRVLDVLAPITSLASGRAKVELHAANRRYRFTAAVNSRDARIRFRQKIPKAQAELGTGIITIAYPGDGDTRPQTVRLRAASQRAELRLSRPTITGGQLRASGTVTKRARGVVRVQIQYVVRGESYTREFKARIANRRWSLNERLSQTVRTAIGQRTGTVHSYTLFTGYYPRRIRGEMRSFQVLPAR